MRSHEQLTDDLNTLNRYIQSHRVELEQRGVINDVRARASRAEANLDAIRLFRAGHWSGESAYNHLAMAWRIIQRPSLDSTKQEVPHELR